MDRHEERRFKFLSAEEFAALTPEEKLVYVTAAFEELNRLNDVFRPPASAGRVNPSSK